MGLTEDVTRALAAQVSGGLDEGADEAHAADLALNLQDRRLRVGPRSFCGLAELSQHEPN